MNSDKKELSIYIHIPFCKQKCPYCDFFSITNTALISKYLAALKKEIVLYEDLLKNSIINSIYIGGGTPSLLTAQELMSILNLFNRYNNTEITVEVNPESVSTQNLSIYQKSGVNRISLGIQSFIDEELRYLGRIHTSAQAIVAIEKTQEYFPNINLDLIYGFQSRKNQIYSLQQAISFNPNHISYYDLTIYPGTAFYDSRKQSSESVRPFLRGEQVLTNSKYDHYEISNYAKKGFESFHNLGYWNDREFLGIGISADSYFDNTRTQNISTLSDYLETNFSYSTEPAYESEYIISALRKTKGMDLKKYYQKYNSYFQEKYSGALSQLRGLLEIKNDMVFLTSRGVLLSNIVFREFVC